MTTTPDKIRAAVEAWDKAKTWWIAHLTPADRESIESGDTLAALLLELEKERDALRKVASDLDRITAPERSRILRHYRAKNDPVSLKLTQLFSHRAGDAAGGSS